MIEQIKPGQYRTRNGIVAVVTHTNDKMEAPFIWVGSVAGEIEVWDRHGRYHSNGRESPWDLVARIPDEPPADDRMRRALQLIAQLADTKSRAHKERFCPNGEGDGIANGWRVAEAMREIANDVVGNDRIESTQTVSPNAATRLTPDEFHAAVMAYMPWIAERIPQHQRVIQAVRLCAKSPEQAACAIEVAWMDGGVEPQPPVDDRIGRALELMLEAFRQRADTHGRCEGWEMVSEAVQILEGRANEQ
jgi:hypothetical protein